MSADNQISGLSSTKWTIRIKCATQKIGPLVVPGIIVLSLAFSRPLQIFQLTIVATALCVIAFFLIAISSRLGKAKATQQELQRFRIKIHQPKKVVVSQPRRLTLREFAAAPVEQEGAGRVEVEPPKQLELEEAEQAEIEGVQPVEQWTPEESPAIMLGVGGIYGIVYGLGITEALTAYANLLAGKVNHQLTYAPLSLLGVVVSVLPDTFRLLGFLVTIIPFIHGAILMFSNKWYLNKYNKPDGTEGTYHFGLAFIFFIMIFFHTALFFFVGLNITDFSLVLLLLWIAMMVNSLWLFVQRLLTMKYLWRNDYFLTSWILINFNTFAFLSLFVFASPTLFNVKNNIGDDSLLNLLVFIVLVSRTVTDYIVGWRSLYNKLPPPPATR